MKLHIHTALLSISFFGCITIHNTPTPQVENLQDPPTLVLWSIEVSPNIDLSARFAAYLSGAVIYRRTRRLSEAPGYMQAQLSQEQHAQLLGPENIKLLAYLGRNYFLAETTDEPDHILQWRTEEGHLRQALVTGVLEEGPGRARAPFAYISLFDALVSFTSPSAKPYVPESFEVVLKRTQKGNMLPWPSGWPTPIPDNVTDGGDERLIAVFPGSRLAEVYKWIWDHDRAGQVVELQGIPHYAYVRIILPGNPTVLSSSYDAEPIFCQ